MSKSSCIFLPQCSGWFALQVLAGLLLSSSVCISAGVQIHSYQNSWGSPGLSVVHQSTESLELNFSLREFRLSEMKVAGEVRQLIAISGAFLPNEAGAPNLPTISRLLALPEGAQAQVEIIASRTDTLQNVYLVPAFEIPLESNTAPLQFAQRAELYQVDAFYPQKPVQISASFMLRGVNAAWLAVTPFQYNPVSRTLLIFSDLKLRVKFETASGFYGEDRLRSLWWEPVLRQNLVNYETLPQSNFDRLDPDTLSNFEYLIITLDDPAFLTWADSLRRWRTEQGIKTGIVSLSQIGGNDTTLIKAFLQDAYNTWVVPPVAVLLLGDYRPNGDPAGIAAPRYCDYLADNIYADMDGNSLPDFVIARIAAENEEQLQSIISKMLEQERNPSDNPAVYASPILTGAWHQNLWFMLCQEVTAGFLQSRLGKEPVREYGIGDGTLPDSLWSTNMNTSLVVDYFGPDGLEYIPATPNYLTIFDGNAQHLSNMVNRGSFLIQYRGHGYELGWCLPGFSAFDFTMLSNSTYPYVISVCCLTGKYNHPAPCFAEAFQRMAHGALGMTAATSPTYSFVNDVLVWGIHDYLWEDFDPGYGISASGATNLQPAFALTSAKFYLAASSWPWNPSCKVVANHFFLHFGDAFMTLFSEVPQTLTVNHDSTITLGANCFEVSADAGAVVALSSGGCLLGRAISDGAVMVITLPLLDVGQEMRITATKDNFYRYVCDVPVRNGIVAPVDAEAGSAQDDGALAMMFPNPGNAAATLQIRLPQPDWIAVELFDVQCRSVSELRAGHLQAGVHRLPLADGNMPSGIYFVRLQVGAQVQVLKVALLK